MPAARRIAPFAVLRRSAAAMSERDSRTLPASATPAEPSTIQRTLQIVGERNVGDARLDYESLTYGWFDRFLKGRQNGLLDTLPRVRYYTMGMNKWQSSDVWPPRGRKRNSASRAAGWAMLLLCFSIRKAEMGLMTGSK